MKAPPAKDERRAASPPPAARPRGCDPFGNGDALGGPYDLRFPGQYFDQATKLHYNYFRDYDPRTGRYIESDPIGLEGGINTYVYAGGNPLARTDASGLASACESPPANDNRPGNWCFGTVVSVDSWSVVTCSYSCTDGMKFTNTWGTIIGGQAVCPILAGRQ